MREIISKQILAVVFILLFWAAYPAVAQNVDAIHYTSTKNIDAKSGAVVSAHPLASKVGVAILRKGGNAIDAAIATQLALAVVYPSAGNLGGGGFMVAHLANGELLALDYREQASQHASRDMFLNEKAEIIEGESINGHLSVGVPGTVAGLFASLKYAKLPFNELIEPAILLAEKGFAITEREALALNAIQVNFRKYNSVLPVFVKEKGWKAGDTLIQHDLANTLKRIRDNGEKGFYEGETARLIVEEMKRGNGIITANDLKKYKPVFRIPHVFDYKGYTIVGMPMPSSGGILIHQMMKMVENKDVASLGFQSLASIQLMVEVERRAFADRALYMGDADFTNVPQNELVNETYLQQRMKDFEAYKAGSSKLTQPGTLPRKESEETTHLSIIDNQGNVVSVTTTLNNSYGSKTVVGGAGFLLNDEMDDFSVKPGTPNLYGAVGGEANAIVPGKRMLSSMTPTVVLKGNKPFLVLGSPGGTTIPTSVFQTLLNIIEFNLSVDEAVNKPKFHHQWLPDVVYVEKTFSAEKRLELERIGYKIVERGAIGRTEVIKVLPDGSFEAVADTRGDDAAEGY